MGLIPLKVWSTFGMILAIAVLLFATPVLRWDPHPKVCQAGYDIHTSWHTLWTIGHVRISLPTFERACSTYEFDPRNAQP